jgi:hypothetical protein
MYNGSVSSTEKCVAYAVFDHLNCVTLDSWPSQQRLSELLGFDSVKTIQRAAVGLQDKDLLKIRRVARSSYRYAPIFLAVDEDNIVSNQGHSWLVEADKIVNESTLPTYLTPPPPTAADAANWQSSRPGSANPLMRRGAYEIAVAEELGPDGMAILARLSELDDRHVHRLCHAYAIGALGDRELAAARLAVQQAR